MGKCSSCLKMLSVLRSVNLISIESLASILETNKRNIIEYKKELESIGYEFKSKPGVGGGLSLLKGPLLPQINLTNDEKSALKESVEYINKGNFLKEHNYNTAIGKILGEYNYNEINFDFINIDKFPLSMSKDELLKRFTQLKYAIDNNFTVEIVYESTKNRLSNHLIHPYDLFTFNQGWFILGFNETVNDIGYFKLNRIKHINLHSKKFIKMYTYKRSDYIDDLGMRKIGEEYLVEIEFYNGSISYIKERIIGKKQTITQINDNCILLKCIMHSKVNIISFVLGFGTSAKLISPIEIKNEIKESVYKINKMYIE